MKDPAIVFYTSDFMVGVSNLTMEERGQYITLLCLQHQLGHLSKKTIQLNVPNISEDVLNKFTIDEEGNYFNIRLQYEIEKRSKFIEHQRENGKKGGRPKKEENPNKTQITPNSKPKQKPLEDEDDNDNENIIDNNVYNYIESNFNRILTPIEYNKIEYWINEYDIEIIKYAVEKAVFNNAKKFNYVEAILNNWKSSGYKTIEEIKEEENNIKNNKTEKIIEMPEYDWLNE